MATLSTLTLNALDSTINELLAGPSPSGLSYKVSLLPEKFIPTGLGGYIGPQNDPVGSIYGRRLKAIFKISIVGGNNSNASSYLDQVIRQIMTQEQSELRQKGIQSIKLLSETISDRSANFDLFFEYLHRPVTGSDIIENLDLSIDTNVTPYKSRFLWDFASTSLTAATQPLADFFTVTIPDLNNNSPAPLWSFDESSVAILQTTKARGGPLTLNQPKKTGPQLLWRPAGGALSLSKFWLQIEFESTSKDGVGLVFGHRGADNFNYFLASSRHQYHLFGSKTPAGYAFIEPPATGVGFTLNKRHILGLCVFDQTLIATLDGVQTIKVKIDSPITAGEIGFLTHGNNGAKFYRGRLAELI